MNTSEVAKLLGVSSSTIQRWIKQLELPMERNERGHFHFSQGDIELLTSIKNQIQNGTLLQDIAPIEPKKHRKGTIRTDQNNHELEKMALKIQELEVSLNAKADSVASYQLLQHRHEIEDLSKQIKVLTKQVETIQNQLLQSETTTQMDNPPVLNQTNSKRKKKNLVRSIFGF
jgi:chromosome-anchoring protein RacA